MKSIFKTDQRCNRLSLEGKERDFKHINNSNIHHEKVLKNVAAIICCLCHNIGLLWCHHNVSTIEFFKNKPVNALFKLLQ